eukprot:s1590_g15.t1
MSLAASMVVCVQSIFAKRKSITSGKKLSPSLVRLIAVADELDPVAGSEQMAEAAPASSSAAGSRAAALPVAASSMPSRQLKKADSCASVSSAGSSCEEAMMRIAAPPREAVAASYRPVASEHVYYTDAGRQTMIRIGQDGAHAGRTTYTQEFGEVKVLWVNSVPFVLSSKTGLAYMRDSGDGSGLDSYIECLTCPCIGMYGHQGKCKCECHLVTEYGLSHVRARNAKSCRISPLALQSQPLGSQVDVDQVNSLLRALIF